MWARFNQKMRWLPHSRALRRAKIEMVGITTCKALIPFSTINSSFLFYHDAKQNTLSHNIDITQLEYLYLKKLLTFIIHS